MWVLLAAIFVAVIVALYVLSTLQAGQQRAGVQRAGDEVRVAASQAVRLMSLCMQQSAGSYTQAQLGGTGFPATTPAGNAWVCRVTPGGSLTTGNAAVLSLDGPPKVWALAGLNGQSGAASAVIQMNFATQIVGDMAQVLAGQSDVSAGVVLAGDATPMLHVTQPSTQDISLSGDLPGSSSYTTPALAAGVSKSAF
jgi:hypothetical protein